MWVLEQKELVKCNLLCSTIVDVSIHGNTALISTLFRLNLLLEGGRVEDAVHFLIPAPAFLVVNISHT